MIRKIHVSDLRKGMYVADTGLSWEQNPYLFTEEGLIASVRRLKDIVEGGFYDVFIDTEKGLAPENGEDTSLEAMTRVIRGANSPAERHKILHSDEIGPAKKIHTEALQFAKEFIAAVQEGAQPDFRESEPLVDDIIGSVTRNPDTLLSLTKLRQYDQYTFTHCVNLAVLSAVFGAWLGMDEKRLKPLCGAALFHDIGKSKIPDTILNKPAKLNEEEFEVMRSHPLKGVELLKTAPGISMDILRGVAEHHEKFNGRGYPRRLAGRNIHPLARIIAVADVYDALTSRRVYKDPMLPSQALKIMYSMRGEDFHPGYVERFIKCLGIYPVGTLVRLKNGMGAVVTASNPDAPLRPVIRVALDEKMRPRHPQTVDLSHKADNGEDIDPSLLIERVLDHEAMGIDPAAYIG